MQCHLVVCDTHPRQTRVNVALCPVTDCDADDLFQLLEQHFWVRIKNETSLTSLSKSLFVLCVGRVQLLLQLPQSLRLELDGHVFVQ